MNPLTKIVNSSTQPWFNFPETEPEHGQFCNLRLKDGKELLGRYWENWGFEVPNAPDAVVVEWQPASRDSNDSDQLQRYKILLDAKEQELNNCKQDLAILRLADIDKDAAGQLISAMQERCDDWRNDYNAKEAERYAEARKYEQRIAELTEANAVLQGQVNSVYESVEQQRLIWHGKLKEAEDASMSRRLFWQNQVAALERQRPLCPDHRDKQAKPGVCLACRAEYLRGKLKLVLEQGLIHNPSLRESIEAAVAE